MLDNILQGHFVNKNIVNLSRENLTDFEIILLSKKLNFVPVSNTIDKAMLKTELRGFWQNITILKWHFRNEENEWDLEQFKLKSTFNPRNIHGKFGGKINKNRNTKGNITILVIKSHKLYTIQKTITRGF